MIDEKRTRGELSLGKRVISVDTEVISVESDGVTILHFEHHIPDGSKELFEANVKHFIDCWNAIEMEDTNVNHKD